MLFKTLPYMKKLMNNLPQWDLNIYHLSVRMPASEGHSFLRLSFNLNNSVYAYWIIQCQYKYLNSVTGWEYQEIRHRCDCVERQALGTKILYLVSVSLFPNKTTLSCKFMTKYRRKTECNIQRYMGYHDAKGNTRLLRTEWFHLLCNICNVNA